MISLRNISKYYGKKNRTEVLKNINLEISRGEMVAIMGKSGCGKTTLMNILGGLTMSTSGEYYFDGKKLKNNNRAMCRFRNEKVGIVVQNYALINNRTAYENIAIALKGANEKVVDNIIKKLGISKVAGKFPTEMSGGECQRTAIARAIINKPDLILADEPTGALDVKTSAEIIDIFRKLNNDGHTVIIVTHDSDVALKCDRIITMTDGMITESCIDD